jgi:hypothetical protein
MLGPRCAAALLLLPLPFVWQDLLTGNIHVLIAAATILGFRWPAAWAFVFLTKVTPGVGVVWFAVRREWRALAIALGCTATIAAISFLLAPGLWQEWFGVLLVNASGPAGGLSVPLPITLRMPVALAIVVWGGLTDRPWTVPLAAFAMLPVIWIWDGFAVLVGVLALNLRPSIAERP